MERAAGRADVVARRGIVGLLGKGVDTTDERRGTVPALALLVLTWVAVAAYTTSPGGNAVGWLTRLVSRDMLFTGAVVGLGLSALVTWSRGAGPPALLATMLVTYLGGTTLSGYVLQVAGRTELRGWLGFGIQRALYGAAVCLPMLVVYLVLRRGWGRFHFGVGHWTGTTKLFSDRETPASWGRRLITLTVWIGIPFFLVMQVAAGFSTIRSGAIVGLALPAVVLALVNATVEETIFRGFLQPTVVHCAGPGRGLWLQGMFFGTHHIGMSVGLLATVPAAILIGVGGTILGKSVLETKGLGWAIAAHAVFDIGVFAAFAPSLAP